MRRMTQVQDVSVPDEIKGYTQVRLDVDLTTGKITESELTPEFCRDWIGGYGYGAKVMWDELKGGEDALSSHFVGY